MAPMNWMIVIAMGAGACWCAKKYRSWFAPPSFFSLYWFLFSAVPLLLAPSYRVYWTGLVYILCACVAVLLGSIVSDALLLRSNAAVSGSQRPRKHRFQLLEMLIIGSTLIGLIGLGIMLVDLIASLQPSLTMDKVVERWKVIRFSSLYSPPFITRIMNSWIYLGALLGGLHFVLAGKGRRRFIAFLPFTVALCFTFILTTKTAVLYPFVLFVAASISALIYRERFGASIYYYTYMVFASVTLIVLIAFGADWVRGVAPSLNVSLWTHLKPSFFGHLSVFSTWFEQTMGSGTVPSYGAYTFAGVFDTLGLHQRVSGLYPEQIMLGKFGSNVYTVFRGLIQDLSLAGSLVGLFALGFASQYSFRAVLAGKRMFIPVLTGYYAFTLWGFVVSIFNYNSILLGFAMLGAYFAALVSVDNRNASRDGAQG